MLRVFEAFAGYGSQRMALRNIGIDFEVVGISEIEGDVILSYAAIHSDFLKKREHIDDYIPEDKEEMISYDVFDGNIFEVTLLDYRRGVKRYLDISNTWVGKPDEVPNAKRIDQMADPFLPIDENSPLDWNGEKCRDSEMKDSSSSENLTTNL